MIAIRSTREAVGPLALRLVCNRAEVRRFRWEVERNGVRVNEPGAEFGVEGLGRSDAGARDGRELLAGCDGRDLENRLDQEAGGTARVVIGSWRFYLEEIMGIGIWELLLLFLIVLLLFGTKRLRNIGGDLGSAIKSFRSAMNEGDEEKPGRTIDGEAVTEKDKGPVN